MYFETPNLLNYYGITTRWKLYSSEVKSFNLSTIRKCSGVACSQTQITTLASVLAKQVRTNPKLIEEGSLIFARTTIVSVSLSLQTTRGVVESKGSLSLSNSRSYPVSWEILAMSKSFIGLNKCLHYNIDIKNKNSINLVY